MGTPFQPVVKSYLQLTEITCHPKSRKVKRKRYDIPYKIDTERTTRKIRTITSKVRGRGTHLPKLHFIAALLLRNEILGCVQQAMDREGLVRSFRREFPGMSALQSRKFFDKFSVYHSKYNKGALYVAQTMPPLYSFYWNQNGYIRHQTFLTQVIGFEFCKRLLLNAKFADPRFFTRDEMAQYEDDPEWHVPSPAEISTIEAEIKKPLYNCIEFPPGYGKGYHVV